jgi:signal transduction histidine kinase/ligand-binding sensor domain-containing protein
MTIGRLLLLWWGMFLAATAPLLGQQPAFRHFDLRDGLPQSQVTALLEDRRGFLWVGTNTGGVARLGATGFHAFTSAQGMKALFVRGIMEDPRGSIWIASQEGVSEVRGETVLNYGPAEGLPAGTLSALALDADDQVLVVNRQGLFRQEGDHFKSVALPPPWTDRLLWRVARDRSKALWLVDRTDHIARWGDQGLREFPLPPAYGGRPLKDFQVDPQGQVWVLLEDALLRMEKGQWVEESLPDLARSPKASSLRFNPRGGYLVALGGDGLLEKDAEGRSQLLDVSKGLPKDRILVALRDHRGVLWVGSDGDGLSAQSEPGLLALESAGPHGQGASQDMGAVSGVLELSGDRFFLASSTGIYQIQFGQGITAHWDTHNGLPANECWALLPDDSGGFWIGTDRGLALWHNGKVKAAGPKELAKAAITTLVRDSNRILVGCDLGVLALDLQGRLISQLRLPEEVANDSVTDIVRHEGKLLLGSSLGLWEYAAGSIRKIYADAPFANATVTAMGVDGRGRLWVGTMRGLHLLSAGQWKNIGIAEGLPDEGINFIAEVGPGRLAIGHNKGLSILEGSRMYHLGLSQGLVSEETNHGGFLVDSHGRLWIGMIGGVCILKNAKTFHNPLLPQPRVLELRWPGGALPMPKTGQIPPRPDFLAVSFDLGAPLPPGPVRYEAFLEGIDEGWRTVNQSLTIQYRNLSAGWYRFRLRAATDGLNWSEAPPVDFQVQPAWYERWLVRGLLGLGLLGLLAWIQWFRIHKLAERARQLEETIDARTLLRDRQNRALEQAHNQIKRSLESRIKLVDMVTHDLRSPLTTILLSLDRLREETNQNSPLLDGLELEAHRIEGLLRNLLDQSRAESLLQNIELNPILPAEVTEGFEEVLRLKAEARGLRFSLEVDPETSHVRIEADTATLHQVMLNLFENALKFTPTGGSVGILSRVKREEGTWILEVWDTGRGVEAKKIEELLRPFGQARAADATQGWGLGLSICQSILDAHHGELSIESEVGQGSRFMMVLPLIL